jgi:transcriptional regulator with XRE-family HTH domain
MTGVTRLYQHIGKEIRRLREEAGMSQSQLADAIGHLRASVANIEAGRQKTPLHVLYAISEALETDLKAMLPDRYEVMGGLSVISTAELFGNRLPQVEDCLRQDFQELKRMRT